jgi:chemotaxis response regulator CheB
VQRRGQKDLGLLRNNRTVHTASFLGATLALSVLLADDSEEFKRAIRRLLESQSEISLVGAATDFSEAVLFTALLRPDIVLLDLRMKDSHGLDAVGLVHKSFQRVQQL